MAFVAPTMHHGGAEKQMYLLATGLDRGRWRPILVTLNDRGLYFQRAVHEGIESTCLDLRHKVAPVKLARLVWLMRREKIRIVIARQDSMPTTFAAGAAVLAGVPVRIVSEHSTGDVGHVPRYHRITDRLLAEFTTAWIGVAEAQRDYLVHEKDVPVDRLDAIHNGIDRSDAWHGECELDRTELNVDVDSFVIGCVAVLRPEKDHKTLLDALSILLRRVPNACLVVVGDGPERRDVQLLRTHSSPSIRCASSSARATCPASSRPWMCSL